jgi:hypothetical protein
MLQMIAAPRAQQGGATGWRPIPTKLDDMSKSRHEAKWRRGDEEVFTQAGHF